MKKTLLFLLLPLGSFSQTDTIFGKDKTSISCKITLVNNYKIFYTEKKVGKYIELKDVDFYSFNGKRIDPLKSNTALKDSISAVLKPGSVKAKRAKVITPNGFIVKESKEESGGAFASEEVTDLYMLAVRPGFATRVVWQDSVRKLNQDIYNVDLQPLTGLETKNVSNKMVFSGFIDKTDKIRLIEYLSAYQYTYSKLNGPEFKTAIGSKLSDNGFKVINEDEDIFQQKDKKVDLALAGEIIHYEASSKGTPGFIVSVVVRWTLYDVFKQENVCKIITGGYSNSAKRGTLKQELMLALADAASGVIIDKEIRRSVYGKAGEEVKTRTKLITIAPVIAPSQGGSDNYIQNSIQSAVTIQSKYGHGSGFLISADGYILTNYHVIKDSVDLQAIFQNDMTLPLQVISYDSKVDVALCKVPGKGYKPMAIDTGNVVKKVGIDVVTIGTPEDIKFGQTVTKGIISGIREINDNVLIQTDVTINPGNSGGMLINKSGEVIGIVVSKIKKEGIDGMGFAIPVQNALKVLNIRIVKKD